MNRTTRRANIARQASNASKAVLGRYLAASLGATGLASVECEAAVVNVDITNIGSNNQNISGVNAGSGFEKVINNFPINGAEFKLRDYYYRDFTIGGSPSYRCNGFSPSSNFEFATGNSSASPFRFTKEGISSVGPTLPGGTTWNQDSTKSFFAYGYGSITKSPDWGAGSYIGFRARPNNSSTDWTYGYFEVTWNRASEEFRIFSGAYESTPNTPIAVPEPAGIALTGIGALALGAGAIRRSRKAAAEGTLAAAGRPRPTARRLRLRRSSRSRFSSCRACRGRVRR